MSKPLLSIVIPTFNRVDELRRLVSGLAAQVSTNADLVKLVILDNASTDSTPTIKEAIENFAGCSYIRNDHNIGMDGNLLKSYEISTGEYIWLIGDDDFLADGCLNRILELLKRFRPGMIFLEPTWFRGAPPELGPQSELYYSMTSAQLIKVAGAHITFISSIICRVVDLDIKVLRGYSGSFLPQLGWILPVVREAEQHIGVSRGMLYATAGNSGGYALFKVFGANLKSIVDSELGCEPELRLSLYKQIAWRFIAGLIWNSRIKSAGNFENASIDEGLSGVYDGVPLFSVVRKVISNAPLPTARFVKLLAGAYGRAMSSVAKIGLKKVDAHRQA